MDERVLYCVMSDGIVFRDSAQCSRAVIAVSAAVQYRMSLGQRWQGPVRSNRCSTPEIEREREDICHSAGWMNVGHSSPAAIKDPQPHGAVSQLRRRSPPGTGDLKQGATAEILPVMSLAQRRRRPAPPQHQR
ncbi:unnamed protein product [Arctogadus glacialis]